jgi:multidrug efflux pump subunit AcrB
LIKALHSQSAAIQVIANVPLAAFGAIVALLIVNRPSFAELADHSW